MVHPSKQIFEIIEPALPESGHLVRPVDQWGKRVELGTVMRLTTFVAVAHQPGPFQDRQMF
ncbi:hypothetical protein ATN84_17785 [Paramesorhizobium deserti]|uniref:Uncharacterized protein n=1 Tax=Paramesorhizobium deserti TaxID=1494590 RepID=A0A135HRL8_9HYPH|nr:hypothetical protein ATN84_17785 [Paramesorhizobium deserti]